jgi:hypothetical protein
MLIRMKTVLEVGRYMLFVPEFRTDTYQLYTISIIFFRLFSQYIPCFAFKKYTGTSKRPFRALCIIDVYSENHTKNTALHFVK